MHGVTTADLLATVRADLARTTPEPCNGCQGVGSAAEIAACPRHGARERRCAWLAELCSRLEASEAANASDRAIQGAAEHAALARAEAAEAEVARLRAALRKVCPCTDCYVELNRSAGIDIVVTQRVGGCIVRAALGEGGQG